MTTRATRGPRRRTVVALAVILAVLSAFVVRLVDIQVVNADDHFANSQRVGELGTTQPIYGERGSIVDTNGTVLASSVMVYDAQLDPKVLNALEQDQEDPPEMPWAEAADRIAAVTGHTGDELRAMVAAELEANPQSQYLPLKKGLSTEQYLTLRDLGLVYLHMLPRETRVYPNGAVAGNLIGYLNGDGAGQSGIENMEGECLAPTDGERTYLRGKAGVVIPG